MFKIEADGTATLEIKIKSLEHGICPMCEGSGIVIPKGGEKRLVDAGTFCSECDEGRRRWQEVVKAASKTEKALSYAGLGTAESE